MPIPLNSTIDVQLARGRLKGALQDAVSTPDEDEEVDNSVPLRGRPRVNPPKRMKMTPAPLQQTFIMKLFDRSVDLAKYNERFGCSFGFFSKLWVFFTKHCSSLSYV